ncbi:hypothetical protein MKX07_001547 [Trichoderma sp. CBMAI-0711]|nr:hypothetical protein MKX07_001547 [Trichoderma sp. CBMAI-0711]
MCETDSTVTSIGPRSGSEGSLPDPPSGHEAFLVNNVEHVELLLTHNRACAAEITSAVSSRKGIDSIIPRAN